MSNYYINAILLDGCPYSNAANDLLKNNNIQCDILKVSQDEKYKYKTEHHTTFPQIYLKKYGTQGSLLLGGYDDLNEFINTFKSRKFVDNNVNQFMNKYNWSKKATLRMIQLINKI